MEEFKSRVACAPPGTSGTLGERKMRWCPLVPLAQEDMWLALAHTGKWVGWNFKLLKKPLTLQTYFSPD